jgi:hypothetical protein
MTLPENTALEACNAFFGDGGWAQLQADTTVGENSKAREKTDSNILVMILFLFWMDSHESESQLPSLIVLLHKTLTSVGEGKFTDSDFNPHHPLNLSNSPPFFKNLPRCPSISPASWGSRTGLRAVKTKLCSPQISTRLARVRGQGDKF